MNRLEHAYNAGRIIGMNGGLDRSAEKCRVGKSTLGEYQNPNSDLNMPADVIVALQIAAGTTLYSEAMTEACRQQGVGGDVRTESAELVEAAVNTHRVIRLSLADGNLSPREYRDALACLEAVARELAETKRALEAALAIHAA